MAMQILGTIGRWMLWLSPLVVVVAVLTLWWLKQQNAAAASILAPAVAIFLMAYTTFVVLRNQRRLDEVQIASQGFAHSWGWIGGTFAAVLLLMFPPVTHWLVDMANVSSTGSPDVSDRGAVRLGFIYGVSLVVAMQVLGVLVAAIIWWRRMGGIGERP